MDIKDFCQCLINKPTAHTPTQITFGAIKHTFKILKNRIKLEISDTKIAGKSQNTWRLNNTLLNNTWIKEEIAGEILKYFEVNINEYTA